MEFLLRRPPIEEQAHGDKHCTDQHDWQSVFGLWLSVVVLLSEVAEESIRDYAGEHEADERAHADTEID